MRSLAIVLVVIVATVGGAAPVQAGHGCGLFGGGGSGHGWMSCGCGHDYACAPSYTCSYVDQEVTAYKTEWKAEERKFKVTLCKPVYETVSRDVTYNVPVTEWKEEQRTRTVPVYEWREEKRQRCVVVPVAREVSYNVQVPKTEWKEEARERIINKCEYKEEMREQTYVTYKTVCETVERTVCCYQPSCCGYQPVTYTVPTTVYRCVPETTKQMVKVQVPYHTTVKEPYTVKVCYTTWTTETRKCNVYECQRQMQDYVVKVPYCSYKTENYAVKVAYCSYKQEVRQVSYQVCKMQTYEEERTVTCQVPVQVAYKTMVKVPVYTPVRGARLT